MRIVSGKQAEALVERLATRSVELSALEPHVRHIVNDVRRGGDRALRRYAEKWDGLSAKQPLQVSQDEMNAAWESLRPQLKKALREAAKNIRRFCEWQKPRMWTRTHHGMSLGQRIQPLESVGCYAPGGRYPLVSTVLMTVIPALVAGVKSIRVASPKPSREVLGAAAMLGVREFYRVGGAQAIAALAYGTPSIARVHKIVGPGNAWVTAAKKLVSFDCAIDMLAGPTEIVVTSEAGDPADLAADLVAQAEHDPQAVAILLTSKSELARAVIAETKLRARGNRIASEALAKNALAIVTKSPEEAQELTNRIAPEHLTVDSAADL